MFSGVARTPVDTVGNRIVIGISVRLAASAASRFLFLGIRGTEIARKRVGSSRSPREVAQRACRGFRHGDDRFVAQSYHFEVVGQGTFRIVREGYVSPIGRPYGVVLLVRELRDLLRLASGERVQM